MAWGAPSICRPRPSRRPRGDRRAARGRRRQLLCDAPLHRRTNESFLATRADTGQLSALGARFPRAEVNGLGRTIYLPPAPEPPPTRRGTVLICTAGTSDLPVAEEAAVTARALKNRVERLTDVGVAGIHRILTQADVLRSATVIIVVAGMDGALPSVVGGLVKVPVIAVPTSVGYGASFGGLAALLAMLNSCASGVTVANIHNGFGAGAAQLRGWRLVRRARRPPRHAELLCIRPHRRQHRNRFGPRRRREPHQSF